MLESDLTKKITNYLKTVPYLWFFKVHGGPYQKRGVPDILVCVQGDFVAFEVKLPGKESTLTALQEACIKNIRAAGGRAYMVTSLQQVVEIISEYNE